MKSPRPASSRPRGNDNAAAEVVPFPFLAEDAALLVAGLRTGNPGAKATFFACYAPHVERLVTHLIGPDRELADILQEVFVQALSSVGSLRDPAALRPWLLRIATHCARRTLRSRTRRAWLRFFVDSAEEASFEPMALELDVEGRETVRAVYSSLGRMPADERIAFALRYIDGMELTEVAAACGISLATVKRRLQRAEERFRSLASRQPALESWLREGSRWQDR